MMKNSLPMMKNRMMPVRMSEKDWFRPKVLEISPAPRPRTTSSRLVKIMMMGLNFAIHDTMTAVKPRPPTMVVVRVWSVPAVEQQAHEAADRAGEHHGADDDPLHLDARIAGSSLALAHHGDLIAVLAVVQIDVHEHGEHRHHKDHQQVFLPAD